MCGIAFGPKKKVTENLENQKDRGLDSIGIIDFQSGDIFTAKKDLIDEYEYFIDQSIDIESNDLCFMHNRKASVGRVTLNNSHPFIGKKFMLAQNGTSKRIMDTYGDAYLKQTDSETLLCLLEDTCDTLEQCLDGLNSIEEVLGTIFIFHEGRTLIYSDGTRGTYVNVSNIENKKGDIIGSSVDSITNYKAKTSSQYCNGFSIICNSVTGIIDSERSYDDSYNTDLYTGIYSNGTKVHKKTIHTVASKKKASYKNGGYNNEFDDLDYFRGNKSTELKAKKKALKHGLKKWRGTGMSKKRASDRELQTAIARICMTAANFYMHEIETELDLMIIMTDYGIVTNLHDKAKAILANHLLDLLFGVDRPRILSKDPHEVEEKIEISSKHTDFFDTAFVKVFNKGGTAAGKRIIDKLFLVPYDYLVELNPLTGLTLKLNLIRHARILSELGEGESIYYFLGLLYFGDQLKDLQFEQEFNNVTGYELSIESHLYLVYYYSIVSEKQPLFKPSDIPQGLRLTVIGFVMAGYVLGLTARQMNVSDDMFNKITIKG